MQAYNRRMDHYGQVRPGVQTLPAAAPVQHEQRLDRLRSVARTLDSLFRVPVLGIRFGVDALIGLIPGMGDVVTAVFGSWMLVEAFRMRVPRVVLFRMLMNTSIDVIAGFVPLLGDLFDVAWKPHLRNLALIERHAVPGRPATRGDYVFVTIVCALLVGAALVAMILLWFLLSAIGVPLV
jgi:Domain of unknown function (DUF4112)